MLNRFKFSMVFPPAHDLRLPQVVLFLDLMREAFGVSNWRTGRNRLLPVTSSEIERHLNEDGKMKYPSSGGVLTLGPDEGSYPIMICVSTGSDQYVWDFMWVDFHASDRVPDLAYFRNCIDACCPTVADMSHSDNLDALNHAERAYAQGRNGVDHRPVIISWFHYFDKFMADTFGGVDHCLKTPAYKVEPFCDGILIQLTPEPLDPLSSRDLMAQRKAMEHLGLPWEFNESN